MPTTACTSFTRLSTPDVWGLNRRTVESLKAQEQAARFQLIANPYHVERQCCAGGDPGSIMQQDADALKSAAAAARAAKVTLDLSRQKLQTGSEGAADLLAAEQSYQQAMLNLVQAQADRYSDTAALFLALGGGWWNRADLPQN